MAPEGNKMNSMKVFLCWSGDRSKEVARILKQFLPKIIERIEPDFSEDIPSGKEWFPYIIERTRSCEAGIVCFRPENQAAESETNVPLRQRILLRSRRLQLVFNNFTDPPGFDT
jgi:hypothetical protein